MHPDRQYQVLLQDLLHHGDHRMERTGTGAVSLFGRQMRFDLAQGFPLLTTKRLPFKVIAYELLFFLGGGTNRRWLNERGVTIWDEWGDKYGNLGPIYSHQWRNFGGRYENVPQPRPSLPYGVEANVYGVGSTGGVKKSTLSGIDLKLFQTWKGMIARCYDVNHDAYPHYGGRGVHVCDRWLMFPNFAADAVAMDGWALKSSDWDASEIDKDIYGDGLTYGPNQCAWVSVADNRREKYPFIHTVMHDSGEVAVVDYPVAFYGARGLNQGNFCSMLRGERETAQGWRLIRTTRKGAGIDQIANLIHGLKTDPFGRRHIVSAWNPVDIPHMALPPCHCLFQFFVSSDGKLSCQLYQRSADIFLGVPFNIASYALLTHMVANLCGYEVGEFIHTFGDVHLYDNHRDQAAEQLRRVPRPSPQLKILHGATRSMDYWNINDFDLIGYDAHPHIPAEVAV